MAATLGELNPFRYRGYYYDAESGLYYLRSRYYDPETFRFLNADSIVSTNDLTGMNLFAYCGNNPIMRTDSTGHAWWHWAIAVAVVAVCAVAVVATAGGAAAGIAAVAAVGNGMVAATTASTVAAGAFIGSSMALGTVAFGAVVTSNSPSEFANKGNWGTVAATAGGAVLGGASAYSTTILPDSSPKTPSSKTPSSKPSNQPIGKPFDPKGPKVQIGVDPRTLTPSKDLSTLNQIRLKNAEIYGRDQALSVYRSGVIEDGNHRLANALANNRAVDIVIFP